MLLDEAHSRFGGAKRYGTHEVVDGVLVEPLLVLFHDNGAALVSLDPIQPAGAHEMLGQAVLVLGSGFEFGPGCCFALKVVQRALLGAVREHAIEHLAVERMAAYRVLDCSHPILDGFRVDDGFILHGSHAPPPSLHSSVGLTLGSERWRNYLHSG